MTKHYRVSYGKWAGNPKGNKPDFKKCAEEIYPSGTWIPRQCSRSCGHGPDRAFCKTHAKMKEQAK